MISTQLYWPAKLIFLCLLRTTIVHIKRQWPVHSYPLLLSSLSLLIVKVTASFFSHLTPGKKELLSFELSFEITLSLSDYFWNIYCICQAQCLALGQQRLGHPASAYKVTGTFWFNSFHCCLTLILRKCHTNTQ